MPLGRTAGWIAAALAVPLCAHALLERAVSGTLSDALEAATGEVIGLDDVEVSLSGALRIEGLTVGDIMSIGAIEARLSLSGLISGELEPAEIVVSSPRADIRAGGARLRRVLQRLGERRSRPSGARASADRGPRQWPHIRVNDGNLRIDAGERGSLVVHGFAARPTDLGLRLVAEETEIRTRALGHPVRVMLGRGAADLNLESARFERAIAAGGSLHLGELTELTGLEASYGIEEPGLLRLVGRQDAGRVSLRASSRGTELSFSKISAAKLNPLFPNSQLTAGRLSGNLGVVRKGAKRAALTGSVALESTRGVVPWLFASELDLTSELAGTAVLDWSRGHSISIPDLHVRRGPALARVSGVLHKPEAKLASLTGSVAVTLEKIRCSELVNAMPRELVGPLRGIRLAGDIEGSVMLSVGQAGARPVDLDVDLDPTACRVRNDAPAADVARLARGHEHLLPSGRRVVLSPGKPGYVSLASLPAHVPAAFIVAEDGRFYRHKGFDHRQIESSIAKNVSVERFARGGSTISQQLAKNLYLTRDRTVGRKLQEAVLAWRIEATLGKRQILERYLNIIQLSDTIYGIDAASRRWFGKQANRLTPREAAFLASLTRAPTTTTTVIADQGGLTPRMVRRVENILKSMHAIGAINAGTLALAKRATLSLQPVIASR